MYTYSSAEIQDRSQKDPTTDQLRLEATLFHNIRILEPHERSLGVNSGPMPIRMLETGKGYMSDSTLRNEEEPYAVISTGTVVQVDGFVAECLTDMQVRIDNRLTTREHAEDYYVHRTAGKPQRRTIEQDILTVRGTGRGFVELKVIWQNIYDTPNFSVT